MMAMMMVVMMMVVMMTMTLQQLTIGQWQVAFNDDASDHDVGDDAWVVMAMFK